jgi:carboxylesterase
MDILKGCESYSAWNKSKIGVLVLQGFTGSVSSVLPLAKHFASKGYNIESPRLTGHGTRWEDLNKVHWQDWISDVDTALDTLRKRSSFIFVAGLSMGGVLGLYLAEEYQDIKGVILINHALLFTDPRFIFLPLLQLFIPSVPGIISDIKDPNEKEIGYENSPTKGLYQMTKLQAVVDKNLSKVNQPVLIFKSRQDHVIPIINAPYTMSKISSADKELIWLENSYHVATQDYDKDIIFQKSGDFISRLIIS